MRGERSLEGIAQWLRLRMSSSVCICMCIGSLASRGWPLSGEVVEESRLRHSGRVSRGYGVRSARVCGTERVLPIFKSGEGGSAQQSPHGAAPPRYSLGASINATLLMLALLYCVIGSAVILVIKIGVFAIAMDPEPERENSGAKSAVRIGNLGMRLSDIGLPSGP